MLHLVCHGNAFGAVLLEDGRGWVRYVGGRELADMVRDRVKIFVNGACHGERSIAALCESQDGGRPASMIYAKGEYPIPSRAVHLFAEAFYRSLVRGMPSTQAFGQGLDKVRRDDHVGEVASPDGTSEDSGPSPFKRIDKDEMQAVAFPSIGAGEVAVQDLSPSRPPHGKAVRADELMMGRETAVASLMEELLPPRSGLVEAKHRLVHLHGEGGIGKTRLAQSVCDALEDYRHFRGGIYELDCEPELDTLHLAIAMLKAVGVEKAEAVQNPIGAVPDVLKELSEKGNVLLMLDNLDPLFAPESDGLDPHPATLLKTVLTECPGVRILSTCRTQLGLGGHEWGFLVDPLASDISVLLFLLCIPDRDVQGEVASLYSENTARLARLVGMLGGHPLSIFLAAQRLVASPDPVDKQIEEAGSSIPQLLEVQRLKGVPKRQRSIRVSLDLSYTHLSDPAKAVFRKASMFPAGLYRQVSTLDALLGKDWRNAAQEATDIGLLRFERDEQRYWTLNPVREYAKELLDQEGNDFRKDVSKHWAEFTALQDFLLNPAQDLKLLAQLDLPSNADERRQRLEQLHDSACAALGAEEPNILYTFQWALDHDFESADSIATGLVDYLKTYDKRQTNVWMTRVTAEACTDQQTRAKWLNNLGTMLSEMGDREGALERTQEALQIRRKLAEKHPEAFLPDVAMTLNNLGNRLSEMGDTEAALDCFRELVAVGRRYAERAHNPAQLVQALMRLSEFLTDTGRAEEAAANLDEAAKILDPLAGKHRPALRDLIGVNEKRLAILKVQGDPRADEVASALEAQKKAFDVAAPSEASA